MKKKLTGILLTGGQSSRMGQDKANVLYRKKPLAQWSLDALRPLCDTIIVSSNNIEHQVFGDTLVKDIPNIGGPLAGLAAALKASKNEINIVLACDTPNISAITLQRLTESLKDNDAAILVSPNGRIHPLIGCYRTNVLSNIYQIIETNSHSLMHLLDNIRVKKVVVSDDSVTLNVNSNLDLK